VSRLSSHQGVQGPKTCKVAQTIQIRHPCSVRGRGGAGGGAAERTPERKIGKLRTRAWPEPHSQRPGLKLGRQAKQNFFVGAYKFW
jgi:hypothetical protein